MDFPFTVPGWEQIPLTLRVGSSFAGPKIFHEGKPLERVKGQIRTFALEQADGSRLVLRLKNRGLDWLVPNIIHGDHTIEAVPPLPLAYQVISLLPFILIFAGGVLGGLFAGLAAIINLRLFHSGLPAWAKLILSLVVLAGATLIWFVVATWFRSLIRH
jgi:hypothetical protein